MSPTHRDVPSCTPPPPRQTHRSATTPRTPSPCARSRTNRRGRHPTPPLPGAAPPPRSTSYVSSRRHLSRDVRRLHRRERAVALLQPELLDGLPGQQRDEA